jgi:hypothetical protein
MLLFGSESITAEGYGEGCSAKRIGCLDANQLLSTQHGLLQACGAPAGRSLEAVQGEGGTGELARLAALSACGCEAEACNPSAMAPDPLAGSSSGRVY